MAEQQLNGSEIFVVDDDETMRDTLSAVFAPEGCRVTCFAEGQSFLVAARARTPNWGRSPVCCRPRTGSSHR